MTLPCGQALSIIWNIALLPNSSRQSRLNLIAPPARAYRALAHERLDACGQQLVLPAFLAEQPPLSRGEAVE
jgi:hypothetical protein